MVELKCADSFANEHLAQCLNYLRSTNRRLALLFNFQRPKVEWKRIVNDYYISEFAYVKNNHSRLFAFICG